MSNDVPVKTIPLAKPQFHPVYRLALIFAGGLIVLLGIAIMLSDYFIFPAPVSGRKPDPDMIQLQVTPDTRIAMRYYSNPHAYYTILYSHGNGDTLNRIQGRMKAFVQHGYRVLAYEYEGYEASEGKSGEVACKRDIRAAYDWLTGVMQVPPERIIIFGYSVGTGPSCWLATQKPAAGLVLECPFLSTFQVVVALPLPGDKLRNDLCMESITMPVLIYHGTSDRIVPYRHGKTLYEKCKSAKKRFVSSNLDHLRMAELMGDRYWKELADFFPVPKP